MKALKLTKRLLFIPLFTLLLVSCDKYGETKFTLTVTNPTAENVTIDIDQFADYIEPNDKKKMRIKVNGYVGESFDLTAVQNESGSLDYIDAAVFTPLDGGVYSYTIGSSTVTEISGGDAAEKLTGEWMLTSGCSNVNGKSNYYKFNADGSGYFFAADCSSACELYGIYFAFNYTAAASSINLMNSSVSDYCGFPSDTPPDETITYTLSGNTLNIGSNYYEKQ